MEADKHAEKLIAHGKHKVGEEIEFDYFHGTCEVDGVIQRDEFEVDNEVELDVEEHGRREVARMTDPKLPSKAEVEAHNLTHLPYRSWCRHCVKGRGKELPHARVARDSEMHEFHFDWAFPGEEEAGKTLKVLIGRMRHIRMTLSTAAPTKTTGEFIAKRILAFIRECGCEMVDVVLKGDQEPVMDSIFSDVAKERAKKGSMRTIVEHSPKEQSQSNGVVERAVASVEGMMRVMRSAFEERIQARIEYTSAVWPWIVEYASYLLNRLEVSHDGKTAYERCKGKSAKVLGIEFGEAVLWKKKSFGTGGLGKLQSLWDDGICLGIKGTTGEFIVGDGLGIHRTRTVHRKPAEDRWTVDSLKLITGVPWRHREGDGKADGEAMETRPLTEQEKRHIEERQEWRQSVPKRFGIRLQDIEMFNPTSGCKGCESQIKGTYRRPHTETCRERFEKLLAGDGRVSASQQRVDEFVGKAVERSCRRHDEEEGVAKRMKLADDSDPRLPSGEERGMDLDVQQGEKRGREIGDENMDEDTQKRERMTTGCVEVLAVNDDEEDWVDDGMATDELDPGEVRDARMEEMRFVKKLPVYQERDVQECWEKTGRRPISTRWVDTRKGSGVRSRWVARDFKPAGEAKRDDLFAAMPPLEAKKILFKLAAHSFDGSRTKRRRKMKLMFVDVSKAHLNGICEGDHYVELPEEAEAKDGKCGKLLRWLYGMRPAAQGWEKDYSKKFEAVGFVWGQSSMVVAFNPDTETKLVVHGDDFTFLGYKDELDNMEQLMKRWYDVKIRGRIGDDKRDAKEITILNRTIEWREDRLVYKADTKHAKTIIHGIGLQETSKSVCSPAEVSGNDDEDDCKLDNEEEIIFRKLAMTANYLAMDRPDIQYAVGRICRGMPRPSGSGRRRLKRLARYLVGVPDVEIEFRSDGDIGQIEVYTDSDWAGCRATRKSTSGGVLCVGGDVAKSWSKMQGSVALSVGEAEYYALVKGAAEALGVRSLLRDLGVQATITIRTDSMTAKGIAGRKGIGKLKHMDVRFLWVQDRVRGGDLTIKHIDGKINPADVLTKPKSRDECDTLVRPVHLRLRTAG